MTRGFVALMASGNQRERRVRSKCLCRTYPEGTCQASLPPFTPETPPFKAHPLSTNALDNKVCRKIDLLNEPF